MLAASVLALVVAGRVLAPVRVRTANGQEDHRDRPQPANPRITSLLEKGLRSNGFADVAVTTVAEASALLRQGKFALVVLDLGLPDKDGQELLRELRRRGDRTPVIVLTARDGVTTQWPPSTGGRRLHDQALPLRGAPSRVRVRLRGEGGAEATVLRAGDVTLDLRTRRAPVSGRTVELTAREFALLETLLRHPGQVLSRQQLLDRVWGYDFDPGSNVVEVYIRYLRQKLRAGSSRSCAAWGTGCRREPRLRGRRPRRRR